MIQHPLVTALIVFFAGITLTLSFAPFDIWPLAIICPAILACMLSRYPRSGFTLGFLFGLGLFTSGSSWVYVSIHDFGFTAAPLAVTLTAIFVSGLALVFALPFYGLSRYLKLSSPQRLVAFPAVWVLGEWSRSWFLTGFPWLYVGYAHTDTALIGWAPLLGVFGVSLVSVCIGVMGIQLIRSLLLGNKKTAGMMAVLAVSLMTSGALLQYKQWTHAQGDAINVALIQPNIPMEMKWSPRYTNYIYEQLQTLSDDAHDADMLIWPEAAIPELFTDAQVFIEQMHVLTEQRGQTLITGILYDDIAQQKYYNGIMALGRGDGIYFKQRLVPFGEYVPLEQWLRGIIAFFDLPNSVIHKGPSNQTLLKAAWLDEHQDTQGEKNKEVQLGIAPSICYEVVYPDLVARNLNNADAMITISNDAWFGRSIGPLQHFQMARMRAVENGRDMIRATNTGLSGIISYSGAVLKQGESFTPAVIRGTIYSRSGRTPFTRWTSYPVVIACLLCLAGLFAYSKNQRQKKETPH